MKYRIVSGGQTGVDRAALDAAIHLSIPHSGWCPNGRKAEDGVIDWKYSLVETKTGDYNERTKLNIRDSDATLIVLPFQCSIDHISNGTKYTIERLKLTSKPFYIINLSNNCTDIDEQTIDCTIRWLENKNCSVLNIAGPRESTCNGVYQQSYQFLVKLYKKISDI